MKTTGVSDIPKFGLLDFLGHPNAQGDAVTGTEVSEYCFLDRIRIRIIFGIRILTEYEYE